MELKNYLIELLSNIIHDKLEMLSETEDNMKKTEEYKKIEEIFSDVSNVLNVDNDELRKVLNSITDEDTVEGIISNVDMIKIVLNGENNGLDLSLDESQEALIKGVYDIVYNHRTELENKCTETKAYLEDFIARCENLSNEIGIGVVRDIDTLDVILKDKEVSDEEIIKYKLEILRNNNSNYNLNLEGKGKEEVELRLAFKKIDIDFDTLNEIEKKILINYGNIDNINELIEYILSKKLQFSINNLFILLVFSNVSNLSKIYDITTTYELNFDKLFMMPGVFIKDQELINTIIEENKNEEDYYNISYLENIQAQFDIFNKNISLLLEKNKNIKECFKTNILSLIIPDMQKNIAILEELPLSDKEFSIIVINPFLATSKSSFEECGLRDYINNNPLRLTTSYYRLKEIATRIIDARKNGKIIFRSLSDKKNYWLSKNITIGEPKENVQEVI